MSYERVSSFPESWADLCGGPVTSGEVEGTFGEVWGTWGTSGLLLKSAVREVLGKSQLRSGTSGELRGISGKSREFQE